MKKCLLPIFFAFCAFIAANAQETPDTATTQGSSSLQVRLSYESHALQSGRDFDISQFLLSPSLYYQHPSGVSIGASGLYLSESDPGLTQMNLSLGYGRQIGDRWYASLDYNHSFLPEGAESPLTESAGLFLGFTQGKVTASLAYNYLFGEDRAHQLSPGLSLYLEKVFKKKGAVSLNPGISASLGTSNIPFTRFSSPLFQRGTGVRWDDREQLWLQKFPKRPFPETEIFGLMAVQAGIPVGFSYGSFSLEISLNVVQPFELENENYEKLEPSAYLGVAFQWRISQKGT